MYDFPSLEGPAIDTTHTGPKRAGNFSTSNSKDHPRRGGVLERYQFFFFFFSKSLRKGYLFGQNGILRGMGLDLRAGPPRIVE